MTLQVNPWYVINLEDFLYYCCPECDNKSKNPKSFLNHAVTSHPNAQIALLLKPESEEVTKSSAKEDGKENSDPKDDKIWSEMFKFSCDKCNYQTTQNNLLEEHKITHEDLEMLVEEEAVTPVVMDCQSLNMACPDTCPDKDDEVIEVETEPDDCDMMSQIDPPVQSDEEDEPIMRKLPSPNKKLKERKSPVKIKIHGKRNQELVEKKEELHKKAKNIDDEKENKILGSRNQELVEEQKEEKRSHVCHQCGKAFKNYETLRTHSQSHSPKFYLCSLCDNRIFTKKVYLRKHLKLEHKICEKEHLYVCDQCDLRFHNFETLNSHLKNSHDFTDEFPCDQDDCGKVFTKQMLLISHKVEAHNFNPLKKELSEEDKAKMFQCPDCELYVKTPLILKSHMKTHDINNFKFQWDQCDFKTYAKSVLKLHVRRKHLLIKETKHTYKCNLCTKSCDSKFLLKTHYLNEHGITDYVEEKAPPKFKCDQCDFQCNGISVLKRHVSKNHKVFLKCDQCDFQTPGIGILKKHVSKNHKVIKQNDKKQEQKETRKARIKRLKKN